MLIIVRKRGEAIQIGDNVKIVVTSVSAKNVKLGIIAPNDVSVMREELLIKKEEVDDRRNSND